MSAVAHVSPVERPGRSRRRWLRSDDRRLMMLWDEVNLSTAAKLLGRSEIAIYSRASVLGFPLGIQSGFESLQGAAERTGFSIGFLKKTLAAHGVEPRERMSLPNPGPVKFRPVQWKTEDVDAAVIDWLATETVEEAARSRGLTPSVLRRWLVSARVRSTGRRCWRVPTEVIDRVVADGQGRETLRHAARRVGISLQTLSTYLRRAGVIPAMRQRKAFRILPVDVDRVVAALTPRQRDYIHRSRESPVAARGEIQCQ